MFRVGIQKEPLIESDILKNLGTDSDGAIVVFVGRARNFSEGKQVLYLEYQAYESMAYRELEKICKTALARWPLSGCVVFHRYGKVEISEPSIVIGVSSSHRKEAFAAAMFIIDTIKQTVPIWKKEYCSDGSMWISEHP